MPVKKYLELDSSFRNRNLYPNCGEFTVNIAQGGQKNQFNAVDPVSDAYPVNVFMPFNSFTLTMPLENTLPVTPLPLVCSTASKTIIVLYSYVGDFNLGYSWVIKNYFTGLCLVNKSANKFLVRRILKSTYLQSIKTGDTTDSYLQLEIDLPIPEDYVLDGSTAFKVIDPTTLENTSENYSIFIPNSESIKDYYKNYYIYNQTQNNYSLILSFDEVTHVATCSKDGLNWLITDTFSIIKKLPIYYGNGTIGLINFQNSININTPTNPSLINCFYFNYNGTAISYFDFILKIIAIIGKTKTGDYTTNVELMVSYTNYIIVDTVNKNYSLTPGTNAFQILPFSYDNAVNFNYTGSMTSLTQPCAYDIKLNSLSLPNVLLSCGGFIYNYPYVYIEIENISSSSNSSYNVMYSNNPNATKAIFKVPITNFTQPEQYQFLNYNGNDMTQTLVIKPNSDMHFVIKLPNGKIFNPTDEVFNVGQPPNSLLQLNAVFSFEKV